MKDYLYKIIIFVIAVIIIFEFTIGKHIDQFNQKVSYLTTIEGRKEMLSSIKKEIKKANQKENYLDEEERVLIRDFLKKISKELEIQN